MLLRKGDLMQPLLWRAIQASYKMAVGAGAAAAQLGQRVVRPSLRAYDAYA